MVEHGTENPGVAGSIPALGTINIVMINDFIIEMPSLKWDKDFLINDLTTCWKKKPWAQDDGQYVSLVQQFFTSTKVIDELRRIVVQLPGLKFSLDTGQYHYLCTSADNILMPHTDTDRTASINIPLTGDMENTPIMFHSSPSLKKESVLFTHSYTCPTIVNTTQCHSVVNRTKIDRYIMSISVFNTWDELVEILSNSPVTKS